MERGKRKKENGKWEEERDRHYVIPRLSPFYLRGKIKFGEAKNISIFVLTKLVEPCH